MNSPALCRLLLLSLVSAFCSAQLRAEECCEPKSWMFDRSTYSHAPDSGTRVAQYARHAFVEELPDPRLVTSGYRTTQTNLRGPNGSLDSYYQVQNWANGRGGLDAEWERFHEAWLESYLSGGYYDRDERRGYRYPRDYRYGRDYGPRHGYGPPRRGPYGYGRP